MANEYEDLAARYRFNETLLHTVLDDFDPDQLDKCFEGGGNSAHWILAHIVMARRDAARMAGAQLARDPWEAAFAPGSDAAAAAGVTPPAAELRAAFTAAGEAMSESLAALTAERAASPSPHTFPDGSSTVGGAVRFLYMHETYHLGQIGYIRRLLGLRGFA